jgi:hypothetical protein
VCTIVVQNPNSINILYISLTFWMPRPTAFVQRLKHSTAMLDHFVCNMLLSLWTHAHTESKCLVSGSHVDHQIPLWALCDHGVCVGQTRYFLDFWVSKSICALPILFANISQACLVAPIITLQNFVVSCGSGSVWPVYFFVFMFKVADILTTVKELLGWLLQTWAWLMGYMWQLPAQAFWGFVD